MTRRHVPTLLAASLAVGVAGTAVAKDSAPSSGSDGQRPAAYTFPAENATVFPEGITREPGSKTFFVGSTTDGTIFRGRLDQPGLTPFDAGDRVRRTAVGLRADKRGNLVVAGGDTGKVFVLSADDGSDRGAPLDTGLEGRTNTFLNDVAISDGYAYVTDSVQPFLYRVRLSRQGPVGAIEKFARFETNDAGTEEQTDGRFVYRPGFNANGIAIDERGRYAVVVQSNTGELFRVNLRTGVTREIDLGGTTFPNGDGLLLKGSTLFVVQNAQEKITAIRLDRNGRRGVVGQSVVDKDDRLKFPTTIALDRDRLLAVNSQFDKRSAGLPPVLPFDVVAVERPKAPGHGGGKHDDRGGNGHDDDGRNGRDDDDRGRNDRDDD